MGGAAAGGRPRYGRSRETGRGGTGCQAVHASCCRDKEVCSVSQRPCQPRPALVRRQNKRPSTSRLTEKRVRVGCHPVVVARVYVTAVSQAKYIHAHPHSLEGYGQDPPRAESLSIAQSHARETADAVAPRAAPPHPPPPPPYPPPPPWTPTGEEKKAAAAPPPPARPSPPSPPPLPPTTHPAPVAGGSGHNPPLDATAGARGRRGGGEGGRGGRGRGLDEPPRPCCRESVVACGLKVPLLFSTWAGVLRPPHPPPNLLPSALAAHEGTTASHPPQGVKAQAVGMRADAAAAPSAQVIAECVRTETIRRSVLRRPRYQET